VRDRQPGEDGQVGVERDPLDAPDPQGQQRPVVLLPAELPLDRAIHQALNIPQPESVDDLIPYRGVVADPAMRVIETLDRILGWGVARPEADLTKAAGELREVIERHPTNTYRHATPGVG
jgi:hypothetical protein